MGQWRESSMTLCLENIRQVAVLVGRQTTPAFGRFHQNVAVGAKFAIYN